MPSRASMSMMIEKEDEEEDKREVGERLKEVLPDLSRLDRGQLLQKLRSLAQT